MKSKLEKSVIWTSVDELKAHPRNPNKHSKDQIERLAKLLDYYGWRHPIIVSERSGFIVAGHGRLEAAKQLGQQQVPVQTQRFESDEEEYGFLVSDNAIASWAELDLAGINADIGDLGPDFDIDLLGLKDFTLDPAEKEGNGDADDVPETPPVAKTRRGELWILGDHRVLCGDATSREDVERLMAGAKADMVFTDPPYGMNLNPNYAEYMTKISEMEKRTTVRARKSYAPVIGDDKDYDPSSLFESFESAPEFFLWGADYYCQMLPKGGSWLVWDKTGGNESLDDAGFQSKFELCWSRKPHRRKVLRSTWVGVFGMSHKDDVERMHPTQKPVKVNELIIKEFSEAKSFVVDPYLGSGSTLIACEKTSRVCYGMEIEPLYVDVILSRWAKFTGRDPVREDGVKWSELNP